MEKIKQIVRIANILEDIRFLIRSSSDHNYVMALILMDYCNETILKAAHYHLLKKEGDKIRDCWKNIDNHLKLNNIQLIDELPYKNEIINRIHQKRNFVQHNGESPSLEDVTRYFAYTDIFINFVAKNILDIRHRKYFFCKYY